VKELQFSIEIKASKESVWAMLWEGTTFRHWVMFEVEDKAILKDIQWLLRTGIKPKQLEAKYEDSE
jgi:hypothetical protein